MITTTHAEKRHIASSGTIRTDHRFRKYKKETREEVRKAETKEDETLKQLKEAWKQVEIHKSKGMLYLGESYSRTMELVKDIECTAEDIRKFSIALAEFQDQEDFSMRAGFFLSALINKGKENDFVICTKHLGVKIDDLCHENTKNIIIEGDIGNTLGDHNSGNILVNGNAGNMLGLWMNGGSIVVNGNVDDYVGCAMKAGNIVVNGNAGAAAGCMKGGNIVIVGNVGVLSGSDMEGGELHIGGYFFNLGNVKGGKIYRRDKLIVDKPPVRDER